MVPNATVKQLGAGPLCWAISFNLVAAEAAKNMDPKKAVELTDSWVSGITEAANPLAAAAEPAAAAKKAA